MWTVLCYDLAYSLKHASVLHSCVLVPNLSMVSTPHLLPVLPVPKPLVAAVGGEGGDGALPAPPPAQEKTAFIISQLLTCRLKP